MCIGVFLFNNPSIIWSSLVSALPIILRNLKWLVGCGNNIYIGNDPIVGIEYWNLSSDLLHSLHANNIFVLCHACVRDLSFSTKWLSALELGLGDVYAVEWDTFVAELRSFGIMLKGVPDVILWASDKKSSLVKANIVYGSLLFHQFQFDPVWWYAKI